MIQFDSNDRLIQALGANLTTVRRLPSPGLRALMWLAILASIALALAMVSDVKAMSSRLMAAPDMWLAALASMLTAVLAATAAFELSLPDRKAIWALLPLPSLLLWIGASGILLPEDLVCCGNFSNAARSGRTLLDLYSWLFSAAIAAAYRHASARLLITTKTYGSYCRTRLRFGGRHASQLCSPLRCGGN